MMLLRHSFEGGYASCDLHKTEANPFQLQAKRSNAFLQKSTWISVPPETTTVTDMNSEVVLDDNTGN
jgi:hypothetical protein